MADPTRSFLRTLALGAALLLLIPALAMAGDDGGTEIFPVVTGQTSLGFLDGVLELLEIEVEVVGSSSVLPHHPESTSPTGSPAFPVLTSGLVAAFPDGPAAHWHGGTLRHEGGLILRRGDAVVSLVGFQLAPGANPHALAILDAGGERIFDVGMMHSLLDEAGDKVIRARNGDMSLTPFLARALGIPEAAGRVVGVLDARLVLSSAPWGIEGGPPGCSDWSGDKDVALISIGTVSQIDSREVTSGVFEVVFTPSARLKNFGTGNVPWYSKFSGTFQPYGNDQHPYLVWSLYRELDGVFQQLGVSGVKHAFLTINSNCDPGACTDSHILGLGCEDVYGVFTNSDNNSLALREEIDPFTGIWAHCDVPEPGTESHFDQDGNCSQDHFGAGEDDFTHGMVIRADDLGVPGATYHFDAWYVVRDDIDIFNSMRHLPLTITGSDGNWNIGEGSESFGPAIEGWVDPSLPGAGNANERISTSRGHVQLAVKTTDLGGGDHRYVYALQNHEVTEGLDRFVVAFPEGSTVSNVEFFDHDGDAGTDWAVNLGPSSISWTAPGDGSNDLEWGYLASFVFEIDQAPAAGSALSAFAGDGTPLPLTTLTPAGTVLTAGDIFLDGFESGDTSEWTSASP